MGAGPGASAVAGAGAGVEEEFPMGNVPGTTSFDIVSKLSSTILSLLAVLYLPTVVNEK